MFMATMTVFASTVDISLDEICEKNILDEDADGINAVTDYDLTISSASAVTISFSKFRQIIPTGTPLLSKGVVLDSTVTYEISVWATYKDNGVPLVNYNLYYIVPQPHFHDGDKGYNKIVNYKGDVLYESESNIVIRSNINIESDSLYFDEMNVSPSLIGLYSIKSDYIVKKSIKINN